MGFMRTMLFLGTGGMSGLAIKPNSKKKRSAKVLKEQVRLQGQGS